jgi:hypothetical protein
MQKMGALYTPKWPTRAHHGVVMEILITTTNCPAIEAMSLSVQLSLTCGRISILKAKGPAHTLRMRNWNVSFRYQRRPRDTRIELGAGDLSRQLVARSVKKKTKDGGK